MKKTGKVLLVILGVIVLIGAAGIVYYNSKLNLLDFDHEETEIDPTAVESEPIEDYDLSGEEIRDEVGELPEGEAVSSDDVINILLLGTDERTKDFSENARADSMMLVSLNTKTGSVKLISFERGLGVKVPGRNDDWLTHTFRYGGAQLTMDTISSNFLVDIDGYVRTNFNFFAQIIDSIGGVDIELTQAECDGLNGLVYTNAQTKHWVNPGVNHLDGYDALQYCRLRYTDNDWHRIERQRNTVQAVINQTKTLSLADLNNLADTCLPMVRTSLTKEQITQLLLASPKFMGASAEQMTIPAEGTHWGRTGVDGRSLIDCDFQKNAEILKEFLYEE